MWRRRFVQNMNVMWTVRRVGGAGVRGLATVDTPSAKERAPAAVPLAYASYEGTQSVEGPGAAPLLVMHGLFGSKGNWNSLCKALHARSRPPRRVLAVDARNHGDSPHSPHHSYGALAADLRALLQAQRVPRAALLGHSMGGRAVMLFALKWPQLVERLLVADISPVSTSASLGSMQRFFGAMQAVRLQPHLPLSAARAQADAALARVVGDRGVRAFLLTNLVQRADGSFAWRLNLRALADNYQHLAQFPQLPDLRYDGPTTFIAGGASDYIQKRDHKEILRLFPRAEFRTIEGAGHWLHSEKPHEFLEIVLDALNRPAPTTTATDTHA